MKRLDRALKGASVETSEEDAVLREYELKRRMARERAVIPREITGAPDDFDLMDLQFSGALRIQIVALTEEGKKTALMLTSAGLAKVTNKEQAKT